MVDIIAAAHDVLVAVEVDAGGDLVRLLLPQPALDALAVHLFDLSVTDGAGAGDVVSVNAGARVGVRQDVVGGVARRTDGGHRQPLLEEAGAVVLLEGADQILVGETGDWDMIVLVEYPNRNAFLEMVSSADYLQAAEHRTAGLEDTVLMATTPATRP